VTRDPELVVLDDAVSVYVGDARAALRAMPAASVDVCVTSPPYYSLRDYHVAPSIWGGDSDCEHRWGLPERGRRKDLLPAEETTAGRVGTSSAQGTAATSGGRYCVDCRAWLGCLGLEPTPDQYVRNLTSVLRELKRVLKPQATLWLNLGDSHWGARSDLAYKPKDLVGIPWMVALALRADCWYLRSDVIWAKPNCQPESVRDRPTRAHEYLFLLSLQERYFYDWWAVREPCISGPSDVRKMRERRERLGGLRAGLRDPFVSASAATPLGRKRAVGSPEGRNLRSVWSIATSPYPAAHFATFPERLAETPILAGSSARGCCPTCGAPWERALETRRRAGHAPRLDERYFKCGGSGRQPTSLRVETGWRPTCDHGEEPVPATVLDPFAGSGTTLAVARRLGRRAIGVELSPEYVPLIRDRCAVTSTRREAA